MTSLSKLFVFIFCLVSFNVFAEEYICVFDYSTFVNWENQKFNVKSSKESPIETTYKISQDGKSVIEESLKKKYESLILQNTDDSLSFIGGNNLGVHIVTIYKSKRLDDNTYPITQSRHMASGLMNYASHLYGSCSLK